MTCLCLPAEAAVPEDDEGNDFVYLVNSDEIKFSKRLNPDAQILRGNVVFRHDSMYMYCDSAMFYQQANSFNAYLNVRVEQGDTLFLFGDSLYYDGNSKLLRVRNNVRLENREMILLADSMNYDRNSGLGYFFEGGTLFDLDNTLTSEYGQYDSNTGLAIFRDSVRLDNVEYVMTTDTLSYSAENHTAYFTCPTRITSGENVIDTRNGWFDTDISNSVLLDRSSVTRGDNEQRMVGDSLVYDSEGGRVWGYGNVVINSFADKIDVLGEYAFFDRNRDSAVVADRTLAIEYSMGDSLFIHADTFKLKTIKDTKDSVLNRIGMAYHHVKAYRKDMQMICDSMEFQSADSCLTLYRDPIVWSARQQILGEVIKAYMNDSTIEWAHVLGQALSVEQIDSMCFNQISSREMKAYFNGGEIEKAVVDGNVMAVYFPFDSDSLMIGMNTTVASNMEVYFRMRRVNKIVVLEKSNGVLYPMSQIPPRELHLPKFVWYEELRPYNREDVFFWRGKPVNERLKETTATRQMPLPTLPPISPE